MVGAQDIVERRSRHVRGRPPQSHLARAIREEDPAVGAAENDAVLEMVDGRLHLRPLGEELRPIRLDLLAEELELVRELAELIGGAGAAAHVELAAAQPLHVLGELADGLQGDGGQCEGHEQCRGQGHRAQR
jgi:hypothetical protein